MKDARKSIISDFLSWTMTRGDTEIGSDIMLWHSLDEPRFFLDELLVSLLWSIFDVVEEKLLVSVETLYQFLLIKLSYLHGFFYQPIEIISLYHKDFRWFDTLQAEHAGLVIIQTIE